ncbi:hypothetical protein QBC46DRAFT_83975 [Diplogelasinospora grovesii]|uniref:Uncharacterized protein n=1 Tax=Diplogelasinospora grovesii TaxID=303347 RepID=A0AAN6NA65_9PEZI|nr:hypothetical protein QBC46DRAFT_83975 [Diplogelasinospora grovesii]
MSVSLGGNVDKTDIQRASLGPLTKPWISTFLVLCLLAFAVATLFKSCLDLGWPVCVLGTISPPFSPVALISGSRSASESPSRITSHQQAVEAPSRHLSRQRKETDRSLLFVGTWPHETQRYPLSVAHFFDTCLDHFWPPAPLAKNPPAKYSSISSGPTGLFQRPREPRHLPQERYSPKRGTNLILRAFHHWRPIHVLLKIGGS